MKKPARKKTAKRKPKAKPKARPARRKPSKPARQRHTKHKPSRHTAKSKPAKKAGSYRPRVDAIIADITSLKVQGAKDIALAGIKCMKLVATESAATKTEDFVDELRKTGEKASLARPTEPALRNCVSIILGKVDRYELRRIQNIRKYAATVCDRLVKEIEAMTARIAAIGSGSVAEGDVILTHCHSSHVMAVLKEARGQKKNFRVIVTETEPMRQGLKTAKELLEARIPVTYCVDSAIGFVMKKATKVMVGCDAILADGSIVNKIGTLPLAIVAAKFSVPFFVVGESLKFDSKTVAGAPETIEQRPASEIAGSAELKGAEIINPSFDTVPADLVTALITEIGVMKPELLRHELGF